MAINDFEILMESFKQKHPKNYTNSRPSSIFEALQYLSFLDQLNESASIVEQSTAKYYKNTALEMIKESITKDNTFRWPYNVAPYFTPEEIKQLKGYYYESTTRALDNRSMLYNIQALEDELRATTDPIEIARIKAEIDALSTYSGEAEDFYDEASINQFNPVDWDKKVRELLIKLEMTEDYEKVDYIKQEIVNLGWNPEIEYTTENQIKAKKRIESIYQKKYKDILTLDLTSLVEGFNVNEEVINESAFDKLKPLHVLVIHGDSEFSNIINKVTNSQFSHSAVCVDNNFNKLYSFIYNINGDSGFRTEDINKWPKENRLAVFSFFVKKEDYDKVIERIKMLTDNMHKTRYSIANVITLPFKHINLNMDTSMICSQFVDSILKLANIDITGKDSSKVIPKDFYTAGIKNTSGKIYKVFDGITKDFNPKKVIAYLSRMANKIKPVTENDVSNLLADYIYPTIVEAKLPIEFNKDGDVLLTNPFVDFDREYSASHKLLLQYDKLNNTEGMKYELARLYYMNYILERNLYHNKNLPNKEKNIKTRARVLNDFNKYLEVLLKQEPNFNFAEYYEKSVFYPHTIEVKKNTLLKLKDIINYIL